MPPTLARPEACTPKSEPFSSVDAAWLHMDKPANLALIVGVVLFDAPLNVKRLRATFEHRLLPFFPRFKQRVREPRLGLGLPRWETVRDAAVGGLRRYLEARGQPVAGLNVRAMVPVNLRPPETLAELGNRFGLVLLSLPVGVRDPLSRIRVLKARMDAIKDTPEAVVAFHILGAMGLTPTQIEELIVKFFAAKASAVMTNVPGPREVLYFAGRAIRGLMFWVPQPGNLALGLSILSYAGEVRVGVATDAGLRPEPQSIVAGVTAEFEALKQAVLPQPKRKAAPKRKATAQATGAPRRKAVQS